MARPPTLKQSLPGIRRLLAYLWPYMRRHKGLLAGAFSALFLGVAMRALEPWPLKFVFDYLLFPDAIQTHPWPALENSEPLTLLLLAAMSLTLVYGIRGLSLYYQKVGFALVGNRVLTQIRGALFRHIQCLPLSFHNNARSGDLIVRVIGDIGLLKEVAVTAFMPLIGSLLVLSTMASLMLWLNWKLALVVLLSAPLYWIPTLVLSRRIQKVSRTQRKREGAMASTAAESIGAMEVVQTLSLDETFANQFSRQNQKSLKEGVKLKRLLARLQATVQLMTGISSAAVLFYGAILVMRQDLSPGELLVFLSYLKAAFKPMQDFAKYSGRMAKASAAGERVIELFNTPLDIADDENSVSAPVFQGRLTFEHVDYRYDPEHPVLTGVHFDIPPKQFVAITGASGAGKSTLIGLVSRLFDPSHGRVLIDGHDIREFTIESLRTQIGVVLQDTLLFATSIGENIAIARPEATASDIRQAARMANAEEFIQTLPQGYETLVGERGVTLSVGQRQRIALARAALRKAPILILDEPTTGLDRPNRELLMQGVLALAKQQTTLMITHELEDLKLADKILYLESGRITEQGSHDELLTAGGAYARLLKTAG